MIGLFLISAATVLITAWFLQYARYEKYLKRFGGPRPIPVLGNALSFKSAEDVLPKFLHFQNKYNGIFRFYIGFTSPSVVVSDCKFLQFLLSSTKLLDKSKEYDFFSKWLGTGLLTSTGAKWKKHRKIIGPAFHFLILEQFADVFDAYSNILVQKLAPNVGRDSFDIYSYVNLCSLDIISATAMGTELNAQENSDSEYIRSVKEICRILVDRTISALKMHDFIFRFSRDFKKEQRAINFLHSYTYSIINSRKSQLADSHSSDFSADGVRTKKSFLDLLLQYQRGGEAISEENIREEVDTFMFEGYDTTSSALGFIFYCLATHPDVQVKVLNELHDIFGWDKFRPATYKDLQEMKYLETVIKESLRLYPPVAIFSRNVKEDIEYDGDILPKNISLTVFTYGLHRRPDIYPDPEKFDPDRFTPSNGLERLPYAYIPFSAGSRNCIGQRFAMLEMKSVVSKVLRNYELLQAIPEHKLVLVSEIILKSKSGIRIRLRHREF